MQSGSENAEEIGTGRMIVLFDGVCNLCNGAVNFIIDRDPKQVFGFASLQSDVGERLLARHNIDPNETDSIVLIEEGRARTRSSAALKIASKMSGPWPLFFALIVVPRPLRDWVYRAIAKRRYRWFGKRETCRLPTPEERSRFIE